MSVIIPAFNASATIVSALESVVGQSFDDWEVLVGDDASSDETASLAASVSSRIAVVKADVNQGPAMARNMAIAEASGELLAFLDSDDLWLPGYLESQVRAYDAGKRADANVGVVACDAFVEDPDGHRLEGTYRDFCPFPVTVTVEELLERNPIFVSALAPACVVREVGGFDPRTFGSEDHDLWLKILERGYEVIDNPVPLAVYRLTASSISSRPSEMARTDQTTCRLALERGRLTEQQRRLAVRRLQLYEAVETVEAFRRHEAQDLSLRSLIRLGGSLLTFAGFALSHPSKWRRWLRAFVRREPVWRSPMR